ncbi:BCCT family transporter [Natronococcus occultus]|uniref:Choline-glycine betaine transporter n=1 Tax=Natronococcus occultus SP4 TaxID=694430 RepID=L0K3X2_9EURY|nr:BCCT family transporter [Natronococcus occultus]AGB39059.1 choline-glycine betaine transporter [Natronococcus occultus SP4]
MNPWYLFGLEDARRGERGLFIITAASLAALGAVGLWNPHGLNETMNAAFEWVLNYFGWWFMLLGVVLLGFSAFIVFSKYGHVRIGGQDAEPEFGLFSWLAMVFTVGYSGSIIIWGVGEPVSIVADPPPDPAPVAGAPIESLALAFMYIHEVFPGLAMWYPPFALAFGLIIYTRGTDEYKFSAMLKVILDEDGHRGLYWIVDLAALIAIVGGVAAAIGFSAQVFSALLGSAFGLPATAFTYVLFAILGLVFLADVWLGLHKGIQNAARATIVLMLVSFAFLFVVGPTLFILNIGLDAAGVWLDNMFRLSLYTAPTADGNWPQSWTSFWWAWWAAWGLFVGSFVARVSKGRTIRETFVSLVFIPAGLLWVQHSIIGGWVLAPGYIEPVTDALNNGGIPAAIATAVTITPYGAVVGVLFILVIAGYVLTSLDSAVYILSSITLGDETPNARNRAWWGVLLSFLGVMTLELPVFDAMQAFPTVLALPFTLFLLAIAYASYVAAREYYHGELDHERGDAFITSYDPESSDGEDD